MIQQLTKQSRPTTSTGNLAGFLLRTAEKDPKKQAIVFENTATTYGELLNRTQAVAHQLQTLGITKGDKVGLLFANNPEFISCFFAVVGLGGVVVPVNPLLKSEEIAHILSDSGAKALIVQALALDEALSALPHTPDLQHLIISPAIPKTTPIHSLPALLNCVELTNQKQAPQKIVLAENTNADTDLALIVYTSGTTGKPKGAMLSHSNLTAVMPGPLMGHCGVSANDKWLAMLPLCHIYGLGAIAFSTVAIGGTIVILEKFDPVVALETIQKERITLLPAVPSMYQFMLMEMGKTTYDVSSIRVCFSGAAALSAELMEQTHQAFGVPVVEGYALSETACGATINRLDARKIGSVGTALVGVEVGIFSDEGAPLAAGKNNVGEIGVKGANIMRGYHNQPEATADVMRDGWFLTGDLGYCDEDGYIFIVGRKKEMIIRGGQNIYPREIEDVIARIPGVRETAVIGVPDSYMGERVKAIIVPQAHAKLSEDGIKEFCSAHLAPYKVPRLIEFRSDLLPRNSTGKVLKRLLS